MEQHCQASVPGAEFVSQHHPEQENESQASTIIVKDYTRSLDGKDSKEYLVSEVLNFSVLHRPVAYSGRGESGSWAGDWVW